MCLVELYEVPAKRTGLRLSRWNVTKEDWQQLKLKIRIAIYLNSVPYLCRDSSRSLAELKPAVIPTAGSAVAKRWNLIVPIVLALLIAVAAGYFYLRRTPKLTDKDTIVLADFTNNTDDPVFDGTLRRGLAIQLAQSPFLSFVSDERIQKTLRLMGQPPNARLTPEFAREVCERTGAAAVLQGSIARLGSEYVLAVTANNCRTGDVIDQERRQARRKEDVLTALSQIARKFRADVGESLATIKSHSAPLSEATTPSLEALKAFSMGWQVFVSSGHAAALPLFKRATEIDPGFATAHAWLGRMYSAIGESGLAPESTRKAWELRDRASAQEKFYIDFSYDRLVTGDLEKAIQTCDLWAQTYPRDMRPYAFLGSVGVTAALVAQKVERNRLHPTLVQTRSEALFQIDVERNTAGPSVGDVGPAA